MKGLVKYRVKSNKKTPNPTKSMLNFTVIEIFFIGFKRRVMRSEYVTWKLTGHSKTFLHVKVKKEAKEGGRG